MNVAEDLQRGLRRLAIWTGVLYLVVFGALTWNWHETSRTKASLCALRGDIETRVHSSEAFLQTHPQGLPGIPAATIQQSLDGQRRTILALKNLECG